VTWPTTNRHQSRLLAEGYLPRLCEPCCEKDQTMYKQILVQIDLSNPPLAKPAVATAVMMAAISEGAVRLVNVLPLEPVLAAEYIPADFEVQRRKSAEEALIIIAKESGLGAERVSSRVRKGGIQQEILEEANAIGADLIVMSSHRPHRQALLTHFLGSNATWCATPNARY
jgi:nucleotide-binding universal stress UspA family protein